MSLFTLLEYISATLAKKTPLVVTLIAIITFFIPPLFQWVHGSVQTAILGIIMLTMGMTLTATDFRILASRPFDIIIGTCAQYGLMPLIAFGIARLFHLPDGVAVGLILVGCCPGGVSSNIMTFLCKGDVAFSVGMTTASTLLAPIVTPILMLYLAGRTVDINATSMFISILNVTILPVVVGFLLNHTLGKRTAYHQTMKLMPGVAVIGLACIVGGVVSAQGHAFVKSGIYVFAAVFIHNTLGYVLGYMASRIARFTSPKRRTLAIEVGMQNAGLATVLATRHFPALPEAAIAAAVSCVWHSVSGALLAGLFNRIDAWTTKHSNKAS